MPRQYPAAMVSPTDEERAWLTGQAQSLVDFARAAAHPAGGFAWLDEHGRPELERPVELWLTCRMTHVFALAALRGDAGAPALVEHGMAALTGRLRDDQHGGWFAAVDASGPTKVDKEAYGHGFVVLAAASATASGHPGGRPLLDEALAVLDERFWREEDGLVVDVWNRDFTELDPYRGVNANMHTVEALLAAHDVTADPVLLQRAARIVSRVVHGFARENGWRLPEHYDEHWRARPDFNREQPGHRFRPYGVTIGHLLEWGRLALHLRTSLGEAAPGWLEEDATALFEQAVRDGWDVDGAEGFVYTTDFDGVPVVRSRMHWVLAEGMATAWTLAQRTGKDRYREWFTRWRAHADAVFIDRVGGSWWHELDPQNRPASSVWEGKPDVYHAYQALLLPMLGETTSFVAGVLAAGGSADFIASQRNV